MKIRSYIIILIGVIAAGLLLLAGFFYFAGNYSNYLTIENAVKTGPVQITKKPLTCDVVNVLSITGGGVHGILPLYVLRYFEEQTHLPTAKLFDLIIGTSSGGVNAVLLTLPGENNGSKYSARQIIDFYHTYSPKIFATSWQRMFFTFNGFLGPKFDSNELYSILKRHLNNTGLLELNNRIILMAYNLLTYRPTFFYNFGDNQSVNYYTSALLAGTIAAPSFFPPIRLFALDGVEQLLLIDVGLIVNDPALEGYLIARNLFPRKKVRIVSLRAGNSESLLHKLQIERVGLFSWLKDILLIMFYGRSHLVDEYFKMIQQTRHNRLLDYHVFNVQLPPANQNIFDGSKENLKALDFIGEQMLRANKQQLDELSKLLLEENSCNSFRPQHE